MPFSMTHLYVAQRMCTLGAPIACPGAFYLGSIAPDAVHYRPSYHSDMKLKSHLCVGTEKWGRVTNNTEWQANVMAHLKRWMDAGPTGARRDFLVGYAAHILTDIRNNIDVWTPYRLAHGALDAHTPLPGGYHEECWRLDEAMFHWPEREMLWRDFKCAEPWGVEGCVSSGEVARMHESMLGERYTDATTDALENQYVTSERMRRFIEDAAERVASTLFD